MSGKGRKQPSKPEGKLGRACRIEVGESQHPENQAAEKPNDEREVIDLLSDTSDVDDDDGGGLSESPAPKRMRLMQNKKIPATQTSFSYDCSDEYERHQAAILAAATQAASTESYTTQKGRHDEQQQKEDEDEEQFFDAQEEEPEQRVEAPASASLLLTNNKNNTKPTPGIEVAFHAALNEASRAPELTQNDNTRVYRRKSISESKQDETKASAMTQRRRRTIQECKSAIETKSSLEETIPARQSTRSQRSTATINSSRTEAPLKPAANLPSRRLTSKPVAVGSPSTTAVTHRRSTTVPLEASGTNPAGAAPCKISAKSQESTKTSEREMLQALQKLKDDAYSLQGKGRPNLLQNIFKTITACNAQINQVSVSDDTLTSTTCLRLHASAKKWCYLLISDAIINGPAAQILQGTAKQDNTQILSSERKLLDALRDRNIAVSSLPRQIKMTCLQKLFTAILACEALIVQMHQDWDTEKQTDTTTTGDTAAAPQTLTNVDARDNAPARTAEASSASKASTVSRWSKRAVATDDAAAAAAHARPKTSYGHRKRPLGPLEAPAVDHPPLKLGKMPMADASRARKGATLATTAAAPRKNTPPATRAGASRAKSLSSSQTKAPPATHNGTKTRRAARENSPSSKPARKTAVAPAAARENSPVTRKKAPFRADSVSDDGSSTCDTKPFTRKSSASKRQLLRRAARKTSLSSVSDDCEAHSAADAMMDDTFPVVDSAEDDTPLLPTVQELSKQCWKCAVTLKLPAGQVCWYATHSHLLLAVPVCSVCAEEVAAVEINVFENDSNTYCAGCAASEDQADTLFFCDNEKAACQRAFCFDCVAKAHGGGVVGVDAARELEQDDELWHCPACSPPTQLLELRQRVARNTDDERNQLTRDLDFLLGQLDQAEQEKKWCELELNTDLEEKANEFRRDLRAEDVTLTVDELEEQVQEAVRVWYEDLQWHESRVADFISGLLDELDAEHSFTAKMCYMALGEGAPGQFDEEQNAPVWVQAADKEVDERMRERGKGPVFNPLGDAAYEEENFDDVEDLGPENLADDETLLLRSGWNMQQRPTARKVEIALRNEEMMRVRVRKVVTDAQDKEEILEDKRLAVARHVAGAIRNEFGSLGSTQGTLTSIQSRCPITLSGGQSQGNGRTQRSPAAENRVILNEKSSTFSKKSRTVSLSLSTDAQETGAIAAHGHDAIPVSAHTAPSISASSLVLCDAAGERNGDGLTPVRTVAVASQLSMILKPHQVEGVQFMWRNSFVDLAYNQEGKIDQCGGCVLAHSMGLVSP